MRVLATYRLRVTGKSRFPPGMTDRKATAKATTVAMHNSLRMPQAVVVLPGCCELFC